MYVIGCITAILAFENVQSQNTSPYWSLVGNSNATSSSKLGTTNAISLNLFTNNLERARITSAGLVGIGVTNPLTTLHVRGFGSFGNSVSSLNATRALNLVDPNAVLRILRISSTAAPAVELLSRASADGANIAYWDMYAEPTDASFRIRDRQNGSTTLNRLTILHSNGNVGIGTTTPVSKLEVRNSTLTVSSSTSSASLVLNRANSLSGTSNQILFQENGATKWALGGTNIGSGGAGNLSLYNYALGANALTILSSNNNIGIGTTSPASRLQVVAGYDGDGIQVVGSANGPKDAAFLLGDDAGHFGSLGLASANNAFMSGVLPGDIILSNNSGKIHFGSGSPAGFPLVTVTNASVGIGTTSPGQKLAVINPDNMHGIFVNNTRKGSALVGIWAESVQGDGAGQGFYGRGGATGVRGDAEAGYYTGTAYGAVGQSFGFGGSGTRYGVFGFAAGGAVNYAGYFDGSVYSSGSYLPSARQLKEDIQPLRDGLSQLLKLKPSTYRYKTSEYKDMALPDGRQMGLIADDVKQVFPELVKTAVHPEQYDPENKTKVISPEVDFEALNYVGLVPVVIASVQEQQQQIAGLKQQNEELKKQLEDLKQMIIDLANKRNLVTIPGGALLQNVPNPVRSQTTIGYRLPEGAQTAQLQLTDAMGRTVKLIQLTSSGTVNVDVTTLSSGVYNYSLVMGGSTLQTRTMTVTK